MRRQRFLIVAISALTLLSSLFVQANEAEDTIDLIKSRYLKMSMRTDLDESDKKRIISFFAEKIASLDTATYNQVILELTWIFEAQTEAMLPLAFLMNEIATLSPVKPRLDERENKLVEVLDFALKTWITVATLHGLGSTLKTARAAKGLPFASRLRIGMVRGTSAFWNSLTFRTRAKWIDLGLTSADALVVACDVFLTQQRLSPLALLGKASHRILTLIRNDLNLSKQKWQLFLSNTHVEQQFTPLQIEVWSNEVKTTQLELLSWFQKVRSLSTLAPSFYQGDLAWENFNGIFVFQNDLLNLETEELRPFVNLLQNVQTRIELLAIPAPTP